MPSFGSVGLAFSSTWLSGSAFDLLRLFGGQHLAIAVLLRALQLRERGIVPIALQVRLAIRVRGTFHPAADALTTQTTDRILPNRTRYFIASPHAAYAAPEQCMDETQRDNRAGRALTFLFTAPDRIR